MKGVAWLGGARVIVNLTSLVSTVILARLLTPQDFGLVALVTAISTLVAAVTELSLAQSLIKVDHPTEEDFRTAWTLNIIRAAILALVLMALAVPMARLYGEHRMVAIFAVVALGNTIYALENPKLVVFQRQLVFSRDFLVAATDKLVAFVVAVTIAWLYRSYWALVIGAVAASIARVMLSYALLPFRPRFTLARSRNLLSFSVWLTLGNLVKTANQRSVPLLLGAVLPTSAVGLYSLGERISTIPLRESVGALQNALFPAYARIADDLARLRKAYLNAQAMTCLFAFPLGIGLAAVAEPMVLALLQAKWLPAVPVIQIIAVSSALAAVQNALPLAMATGHPEEILYRNLRSFAIQIPLLAAGYWIGSATPFGGLAGAVAGSGCATLFNTLLNLWLVRKLVGLTLRRQLAVGARPLLASLAMAAAIAATRPELANTAAGPLATLVALVALGGAAYLASLAALLSLSGSGPSAEREVLNIFRSFVLRARGLAVRR